MHVTLIVSTDTGELALKRSFNVTQDQREECIQAAATLLNVSMSVVEEIERKDTTYSKRGV